MVDVDNYLNVSNDYFERFRDEPEEVTEKTYGDSEIPWLRDLESGEVIVTRPDGETRFGVFGPTGSGKTVVIKRIAGVAYSNGFSVAHASDVKNDFQSVNKFGGVPKKAVRDLGLMPGEDRFEMPRTLGLPKFMVDEYYSSRPEYGKVFTWGFQDIGRGDFEFLLGDLSSSQQEVVDLVLDKVEFGEGRESFGESPWDKILSLAEEEAGANTTVLRKLKSKRSKGLISGGMRVDLVSDLDVNEKGCVSLGLKLYTKCLNSGMDQLRFYSGIFQRNIASSIESGDLDTGNGLILVNDEFQVLDDPKKTMTFNREFNNLLKISGRQADISTVIASQRPAQVSNSDSSNSFDFLSDLTDVVILKGKQNINEADWKTVLRSMGIYRGKTDLQFCRELFGALDRYEGVYISSERHETVYDLQKVKSLAPPVHHPWND
jgi:hypothetical protein